MDKSRPPTSLHLDGKLLRDISMGHTDLALELAAVRRTSVKAMFRNLPFKG